MQKFIAAVESLHPGCKVVDVHLLLEPNAPLGGSMAELDEKLAVAVANSTLLELSDLLGR